MTAYRCPAKGGVDANPSNLCPREEITDLCCISCVEPLCGGEHTCLKIKSQRQAGGKVESCGSLIEG